MNRAPQRRYHSSSSQISQWRRCAAVALAVALVLSMLVATPARDAAAQVDAVVINEIVAANDSYVDNFGDTPDWIELQNNSSSSVSLAGWTIADNGGPWTLPPVSIGAGEQLVIFASGRNEISPVLHTDFGLKRSGETVTLADASGALVDQVAYPELGDDVAYGRGPSGGLGFLIAATPVAPNAALAPSGVEIVTPGQAFTDSLEVTLAATAGPGESVRYTTDGEPVTAASPIYSGPVTLTTSAVVRAAVTGNGQIGPESSAGYIAVTSSVANFSSDLPLVVVHASAALDRIDMRDAIVSVIDRSATGRTSVLDPSDYLGFGGLRIRGSSSAGFAKKQFKFELWEDRTGTEVDADLLGLGSESDWTLYAPGTKDRAMINNPFIYELGLRGGVVAPGYQFVELFLADDPTAPVSDASYQGLYLLRESIKIGEERVDIAKHTSSSAGADGGYILRYDRDEQPCCVSIGNTGLSSVVSIDSPGADDLTSSQLTYIQGWWDGLVAASETSYAAADEYIDFDSVVDSWLLSLLGFDPDTLRYSHYMHVDAGGQLQGGPLWDFDRGMGANDPRSEDITDGERWDPNPGNVSGHAYDAVVYRDLWEMPEVQARLRARWAQWRSPGGLLSDSELALLVSDLGTEISEAYQRDITKWTAITSAYGSRFGGLTGELDHLRSWVLNRADWLDGQFLTTQSPPVVTVPAGGVEVQANTNFSYQVQATDDQTMVYAATGLPEGLSIGASTGVISGLVGYGDIWGTIVATITVTDSTGAVTTAALGFSDPAFSSPVSSAVVLNEFNAVAPGSFLGNGGADSTLGQLSGNGGDWFELVTVDDQLDLRGWRFDIFANNDDNDVRLLGSLQLGQDARLSNVRGGSIITVAESQPEDLSYDPRTGDWAINLHSSSTQAGALWASQADFDTNHKRWRLVIRDAGGAIRAFVGGETEYVVETTGLSLSSDEVMILDQDPAAAATTYRPATQSTFGAPNALSGGGVQDLAALRPNLAAPGDVNCIGGLSVADAVVIAQYLVGLRTDAASCPMTDPVSQVHLNAADVNNDSQVTIVDAVMVAQCTTGLVNELCP